MRIRSSKGCCIPSAGRNEPTDIKIFPVLPRVCDAPWADVFLMGSLGREVALGFPAQDFSDVLVPHQDFQIHVDEAFEKIQ